MSLVSFPPAILSATMGFLIKIQGSEKPRIKTTMAADEDAQEPRNCGTMSQRHQDEM